MSEARTDLWHVQLASGDLEVMTLDQLDDAFNSDRIDENVMVLQGGALKWSRLGEILGLDEEEEQPVNRAQALPAFASPLETANRQLVVPTPLFLERPSEEAMTPSVRPMAYDVASSTTAFPDDDFDPERMDEIASLRPSKKKFVVVGLAAGLLLAIAGVGLSKVAGSPAVDAAATNANISSAIVAASQPAASHPHDTSVSADSLPGSRLSDDQKKMLAGMDKKLEDAQKAKAEAAAERASKRVTHGKFKKGKSGLKEGGDEHDPLNASLHKSTGKW
ncbi:MAG: hypothetical protein ABI183_08230 [Polyangiaceae bacterium]